MVMSNAKDCFIIFILPGNKAAPTFQILRHVQVKAGDITAFDLGMFYIADPDTSPDKLYVVVLKVPGNGNLIKAIEGVDVVLQKGDNFTLTDIMAGKVRFLHRKFQGEKGTYFYYNQTSPVFFFCFKIQSTLFICI